MCFGDSGQDTDRTCHVATDLRLQFEELEAKTFHWHRNVKIAGDEGKFLVC